MTKVTREVQKQVSKEGETPVWFAPAMVPGPGKTNMGQILALSQLRVQGTDLCTNDHMSDTEHS